MLDRFIPEFDRALRAVAGITRASRPNPADAIVAHADDGGKLSDVERRHAAGLMRVNHVGEVCAQALYQGQALFARAPAIRAQLDEAAREEEDHLAWCAQRLQELNDRPSLLNPLWYAGAFAIGALAGRLGDKISLGFVAETERQVEHHLDGHLDRLPEQDARSRAIVAQMRDDEVRHGDNARAAGGIDLPTPVREAMRIASRVMTTAAYRI
ncbi:MULTISPECIES: 2-polyprenyl-3-methyl-6-methoxy-1,4-benzoquinone monooxygenase [Ralstonia solanacearum species complex]|uniref:2-polyprenyl-3-methyl-6-methoxy-1,4-benzoquinone monooxygenase n=1 Tax=Ralstonia solanacearum species complex TaxID=3116862 RepID=UPI000E5765B4|nr:2-polyprenyl-3-methyl-6-methoxy-1,4-benzoquinone monooxygenase [Ralstonia solanacearum]BEU70970.1 2-polyprenyl-3-methyl-6-methoxy-1,4-benzoquinone monooxygenase [Ralstonia pseudosolanacearum]AXV75974.1 demethoxyubiquinone hydroxylase family protein [Ralstonia solanacearum]AXV89977.1 demethoxyubiquinone hydroxylase family protein [Ralstonia solanacearum]AXW18173.1 demethoxyubiquinone hydroxylase family protein [Ralstonia solanacearum]AXW74886.1 demethoxyubiquinone hydroxylase family protein 